MDRISELPQPILHNILSYLSQKHAIQTCTLSKSWRYIGSTRPKVELRQSFFQGNIQGTFFSVLSNTLQRYHDQNLSIQDFLLDISAEDVDDWKSVSLMERWIPIVVMNMRVKTLNLKFLGNFFHMPPAVFQAESLEELYLEGCNMSRINHTDKVLFKFNRLRTLSLTEIDVSIETFERIISACPLIERVTLNTCRVLGPITLNNVRNLKYFAYEDDMLHASPGIEIDAPSVECISITGCRNWIHSRKYLSYTRLKSLNLSYVQLSENSFHMFSVDFCCLEDLTLYSCFGFNKFKLESRSIKNLSLGVTHLLKADIDVPNILSFELSCYYLPSVCFKTTSSHEWKSKISILSSGIHVCNASSAILGIYKLHKTALNHSEFSLHIDYPLDFLLGDDGPVAYPPAVVIENLSIGTTKSFSSLGPFFSRLFRFFHPRYMRQTWYANPENSFEREVNQLAERLPRILENLQDLEEVRIESSKQKGEEPECGFPDKKILRIRLRLKWRELV